MKMSQSNVRKQERGQVKLDTLARFFEIDWVAVYVVHGQGFFITGLVASQRSRRHSELELARSVPWLAAYGSLRAAISMSVLDRG